MSPAVFRMVLIVSCAHALVHVFELSLPSVEQMIGQEFSVGTERTGVLGTVWRLPFGLGALLAGWLADRYGSKRLLLVYLVGCAATAVFAAAAGSLDLVFLAMFGMGCFASIYHPAGLAAISKETTAENRGAALGWHGIFGSTGIAAAPFIAAVVFSLGSVTWRQYYLVLTVPAIAIAALLWFWLHDDGKSRLPQSNPGDSTSPGEPERQTIVPASQVDEDSPARWHAFLLLVVSGALSGFIYAAFMHFLPRYLDDTGFRPSAMPAASYRNWLTALVLVCGVAGQAWAGRLAKPDRLEGLLAAIFFANAPLLLWMAFAEGPARLWATCALALVHFMNQPVYNSLIAHFVPRHRRSVSYGFSNMVCFGIGALGPAYAGYTQSDRLTYGGLAVVACLAGCVALVLRARRPE